MKAGGDNFETIDPMGNSAPTDSVGPTSLSTFVYRDLPTLGELEAELNRVRGKRRFRKARSLPR